MPSIYYSKPASLLLTSHCSRVFRISRLLQESSNATSVPAPDAGESNTVTERAALAATSQPTRHPSIQLSLTKSANFRQDLGVRLLLKLERGQRTARCSAGLVTR